MSGDDTVIDFAHEAAKLGSDLEFSVADALNVALKEYLDRENPGSLFRGDEVLGVYIAFHTKSDDTEGFPSVASSASRLGTIGLVQQHLNDLTNR